MQRALIVGVNAYPSAPLSNCVNDANRVANFITSHCGFAMEDVHLVTDARATTDRIKDRLAWLVADARLGDRLLYYYSGHGTLMAPRDKQTETVEKLVAAECPVDFDWSPQHAITADDLRDIFREVPQGIVFNFVSDSCHSGSLTRLLGNGGFAIREYPMPADMRWRVRTAKSRFLEVRDFSRAVEHFQGAFISGCREDQTSADGSASSPNNGALTGALFDFFEMPSNLALPLTTVVESINKFMRAARITQEPQLRGDPEACARPWLQ